MRTLSMTCDAIGILLLCLTVAEPVQACSSFDPQEVRASRQYDRIVAATILASKYDDRHKPDWEPWSAQVKTISSAQGVQKGSVFDLYRSGSHGGGDCDDGEPIPKVGEIWILYLLRNGSKYFAAYSLPFTKARKMDPRFRGPVRPTKK